MGLNDYALELYVKAVLQDARAAAQRRALRDRRTPVVAPAVRTLLGWMRARYARWSSAASAPTTRRAASKAL